MKRRPKPILITGSHRCGSTWVGKMLTLLRSVKYIDEVFNLTNGLLKNEKVFDCWFPYITEDPKDCYSPYIWDILNFKYSNFTNKIYENQLFRLGFQLTGFPRPLLKDPHAAFSSEWLSHTFNMSVVVIIRHPASFVASIKRLNWRFNFYDLLRQDRLIKDYLYEFKEQMNKPNMDIIEEASLLWLCIYSVLDKYIRNNPEWIVIKHEDLCSHPEEEFALLYKKLGICFTEGIKKKISEYSSSSNPTEAPENAVHYLKRNSKGVVCQWKDRIISSDIDKIREIVSVLSDKYYSSKEWE